MQWTLNSSPSPSPVSGSVHLQPSVYWLTVVTIAQRSCRSAPRAGPGMRNRFVLAEAARGLLGVRVQLARAPHRRLQG